MVAFQEARFKWCGAPSNQDLDDAPAVWTAVDVVAKKNESPSIGVFTGCVVLDPVQKFDEQIRTTMNIACSVKEIARWD